MTTIKTLYLLVALVGFCAFAWATNATLALNLDRYEIDWQVPQEDG